MGNHPEDVPERRRGGARWSSSREGALDSAEKASGPSRSAINGGEPSGIDERHKFSDGNIIR